MPKLSDKFLIAVVPPLGGLLLKLLKKSGKFSVVGRPELKAGENIIFSFWHGRMLMLPFIKPEGPVTIMVSRHKDGELISRLLKRFGIGSARGSTTRGGMSALKEIIRLARKGHSIAFSPDGPRGPRYVAQMGVIQAAAVTGLPIYPITYSALKKKN
jgi:lysophospholipid acyltransferase (LPLAT)-like uncharacterized protein